jgi:hypothetical protein
MSNWEQVLAAALAVGEATHRGEWEKQSSKDVGTRGMAPVELPKDHPHFRHAQVIGQIYDGSGERGFVTLKHRPTYATQHRLFE